MFNNGVRKLEDDDGRFTSIDPSWDSFHAYSPYHYSKNNPANFIDFNGQFPITFHTRGFAPWNWFGHVPIMQPEPFTKIPVPATVSYEGDGDNRKFTTATGVSYRIGSSVLLETTNMSATAAPYSPSTSVASVRIPLIGEVTSWSSQSESNVSATVSGNTVSIHTYGNNDAAPLSPDIDVLSKVSINVSNLASGNQLLSLSGTVVGDNFPASESFVSDARGNKVFLGVSSTHWSLQAVGPFTMLPGFNHRPMATINTRIIVNSSGIFVGVLQNGRQISITDWNRQFESQDPK